MNATLPPRAVLFDLDGTLVDSAPDLIAAVQRAARRARRAAAGCRSRARGRLGRRPRDAAPRIARRRRDDDRSVAAALSRHLFGRTWSSTRGSTTAWTPCSMISKRAASPGASSPTSPAGSRGRCSSRCALHLRCAALVTGDCLPVRKPDPAPVLRACELAGVEAFATAFVGDDLPRRRGRASAPACSRSPRRGAISTAAIRMRGAPMSSSTRRPDCRTRSGSCEHRLARHAAREFRSEVDARPIPNSRSR